MHVIDLELEVDEIRERMRQAGRRDVVADLAPLPRRPDQPTSPKAGQVVRDIGPADTEPIGQIGRIGGTGGEDQQDLAPGRVGQRRPHPLQRLERSGPGVTHTVVIQDNLNSDNPELSSAPRICRSRVATPRPGRAGTA